MASVCFHGVATQASALTVTSSELIGTALRDSSSGVSAVNAKGALLVQPVAKRVCDLTGKKANNGYRVSFSNHRTKHLQGANLQYKRLWWEEGNKFVKMRLSTNALKTVDKKGLSQMAKEAGIDLLDFVV